jgi:hypothetical protein
LQPVGTGIDDDPAVTGSVQLGVVSRDLGRGEHEVVVWISTDRQNVRRRQDDAGNELTV